MLVLLYQGPSLIVSNIYVDIYVDVWYSGYMKTRRKTGEEGIRKLTKFAGGSSYGITLPIGYVRELGWKERQKLTVRKVGKKLIIEDWEE